MRSVISQLTCPFCLTLYFKLLFPAVRFSVEVESTPLAKICEIEGMMTMLIAQQEIAFEHPGTRQIKYRFMLAWMRRFGKQAGQVYFECGRKCPNGEGTIKCVTESAKMIHKIFTENSASKGKTVIPHKPNETAQKEASVTVESRAKAVGTCITNPSLALNASRKHPGQKVTPTLVPITPPPEEQEEKPFTKLPSRASGKSGSIKDESENGEQKVSPVSSITRELENKFNPEDGMLGNLKRNDESKSSKTKDKKKEKEEKKEREKKEKEEKKERERREKEEKKEREKREKENKKKSKKKEENIPAMAPTSSFRGKNNIYSEPEPMALSASDTGNDVSNENLYDEAGKNITPILGEYAEPYQIKNALAKVSDSQLYDEANPNASMLKFSSQSNEYAQPYNTKKSSTKAEQGDSVSYTYATPIESNNWKTRGRKEDEEHFEENYDSIKNARESMRNAPPIPTRGYSGNYDDNDDDDDTYNRLDLKHCVRDKPKQPENLYGEASAKKVEPFTQVLPVRKGDDSDSEEEEEEEDPYDAPQEEGYEDPQELRGNSFHIKPVPEAYEDAVPIKTTKPKSIRREPLYEEVS